jgi:hypothetical protein
MPKAFNGVGAQSITSAVHLLLRFHLYDSLLHALNFPPHENRIPVAPTPLVYPVKKLVDVSCFFAHKWFY